MQNYVQTNIVVPSIEKMRAHQGTTEELQMEFNLTLKKFKSMREVFRKMFCYLDRHYVKHHTLETIEESATNSFKICLDENLHPSEIVKYSCDRWLKEQQNDDTSVERFILTTKAKVVEERNMLEQFGFEDALLAQPEAQDGVTSKYILDHLIVQSLEHERNNNGAAAEVVRNKFVEVFNVYDGMQQGDQNNLVSHTSSSNIHLCVSSLLSEKACLVTNALISSIMYIFLYTK